MLDATQLAPLDPGLIVLRGEIYQGQDAYSAALRDFSEALERNPDAVTTRNIGTAECALDLGLRRRIRTARSSVPNRWLPSLMYTLRSLPEDTW